MLEEVYFQMFVAKRIFQKFQSNNYKSDLGKQITNNNRINDYMISKRNRKKFKLFSNKEKKNIVYLFNRKHYIKPQGQQESSLVYEVKYYALETDFELLRKQSK